MKLGNWFAVASVMGLVTAGALAAEGCTASVTAGNGDLDGGSLGSSSGSGSGSSSGSGSGSSSGGPTSTSPCAYCLYPGCAGQWSVCATQSSGDCVAILQCALQCSDSACVGNCVAAHPGGEAAYRSYAACDTVGECGSCTSDCAVERQAQSCPAPPVADAGSSSGGDDASVEDSGTPPPPDDAAAAVSACQSCQQSACGTQLAKCTSNDSDCAKYNQCIVACADAACITKCASDHPQGSQDATALGTCTAQTCTQACGL